MFPWSSGGVDSPARAGAMPATRGTGDGGRPRRGPSVVFALGLMLSGTHAVNGEIYRWTDENGQAHFGDRPPLAAESERVDVEVNAVEGPPAVEQLESFLDGRRDVGPSEIRQVTIFTTDHCPICRRAKAYFAANDIAYTEVDIESSADARKQFNRLGGRGVPLIMVGTRIMHGFSAARFAAFYDAR